MNFREYLQKGNDDYNADEQEPDNQLDDPGQQEQPDDQAVDQNEE